ncbi:diaminobutyrate--2-oxoglutarate transaminase family protein [Streptomyces mirabilis]|uniref:Diaminobutyrate--2-oxoglutarate transaminase n=1 Tax=Streptomyces mirabilis TaxID=68239 RepID=A0ABU3UXR3_9ACTN|nr:diaminobutyrate--2-oxoglutarate transaminase family protein [Streptomyces mirabilis]MDU8998718.1 diaminobutyrate--2-oxoglutarate transaminase family protein [Streptomyces mirabilis]
MTGLLTGPRVVTEIPGPQSRVLLERQAGRESNARAYPRSLPIAVARASGSLVEDVDGNVFLDCLAGAGVLALGHGHPELVAAAERQLHTFVHGLDLPTAAKDEFTTAQFEMLPAGMRERMRIHFCGPTGANAVDAAVKLCKIATGRGDVVTFQGGFHGSTHAAMALSGLLKQKNNVANGVPGTHFFPYSSCHACPLGLRPDSCEVNCAGYLERALTDANGGVNQPAAVILELVQGEGGVVPARPEFIRRIRDLTRELDIPLIVDEVQTGCGRTGTWFAFEQYGIEPDVVIASKALSGIGLPVAVILYDERLDVWEPGAHSGTFRGNQLAFAAGVEAVRVIRRDGILNNVRARGEQLLTRLRLLSDHQECVREVRGLGLMIGIDLVHPETGAPASDLARAVQVHALNAGLIVELGGRENSVVRLLPPLVLTEDEADFAAGVLEEAIKQLAPVQKKG